MARRRREGDVRLELLPPGGGDPLEAWGIRVSDSVGETETGGAVVAEGEETYEVRSDAHDPPLLGRVNARWQVRESGRLLDVVGVWPVADAPRRRWMGLLLRDVQVGRRV